MRVRVMLWPSWGEGGCFQCKIGRTGAPSFKVVDWPDGGDASQEEPACGAHYHPYGPVELNYVTAMISECGAGMLAQSANPFLESRVR